MAKRILAVLLTVGLLSPLSAQSRLDPDINTKIRTEANTNSQIMRTLHFLADVYGPRVTGTPSLRKAGEWAIETMKSWGFTNGHLEPWEFGRPGWTNDRFSAHILSPVKDQLTAEVLAWTPGTNGTVTGRAFALDWPQNPTADQLTAYLDSVKSEIRGRIVLAGRAVAAPVNLNPPAKRRDDERVRTQYSPNPSAAQAGGGRGGAGRGNAPAPNPPPLTAAQVGTRVDEFLVANGALVRLNDARREHGQITAFNNRTYDVTKAVPTVVLRNEDYGRIWRILADGTPVELEFNIVNSLYPEGRTAYNVISEIAGTDRSDEVVLLGGHLDSWHSATGATDNAVGCAVMMEAARILKAIGVQPRRTIRVALWSGEEQGLLGSQAYVKEHYGPVENPKSEHSKVVAYLNLDTGTGRVRGATVFGPAAAAAVIREALVPFADLGVAGARSSSSRSTGGTDHTSFNAAGLPGIGFDQDPIEYDSHTHHTNLDTYERVIEADVKAAATSIAAVLYQLAMRDEMLPRFDKATIADAEAGPRRLTRTPHGYGRAPSS